MPLCENHKSKITVKRNEIKTKQVAFGNANGCYHSSVFKLFSTERKINAIGKESERLRRIIDIQLLMQKGESIPMNCDVEMCLLPLNRTQLSLQMEFDIIQIIDK